MEPQSGVHELIDAEKGIAIFGTGSVQVGTIDAHPPLSIGFLDEDDIR